MAGTDHDKFVGRVTERQAPCTGCHPSKPDPRCVYPEGHVVHWDGGIEIWLSPTVADDLAIAEAEARGYQRAIDVLRDENRFMRWLIDYHLEHPEDRRHSCEFHVAYLEASAHTAIRSGESTDE